MTEAALTGIRVLLVEDEAIIAMTAEDMLEDLGCIVAAAAPSLAEAIAAVETARFDVALLDINLNGETSVTVAHALRARGRPFVVTTGYGSEGRDDVHGDAPLVTKPYRKADLADAIARALERAAPPGSTERTAGTR